MKNYTTIKMSGSTKRKTTCESYVLCGVDNVNNKETRWIVAVGGIDECVSLIAHMEIGRRVIEEYVLQNMLGLTKEMLQEKVEQDVARIRQIEREQERNA